MLRFAPLIIVALLAFAPAAQSQTNCFIDLPDGRTRQLFSNQPPNFDIPQDEVLVVRVVLGSAANCTVTLNNSGNGGALRILEGEPGSERQVTRSQQTLMGAGTASFRVRAISQGTDFIEVMVSCGNHHKSFDVRVGPPVQRDPESNEDKDNTQPVNDPVSTSSGELHDHRFVTSDLSLGGPLPLDFGRYYAAFLNEDNFDSAMGPNWMHNFNHRINLEGDTANVLLFGGRTVTFTFTGPLATGVWRLTSVEKLNHQLIENEDGSLRFLDLSVPRIYHFTRDGVLTGWEDRNGNMITVTQGPNGPTRATDGLGRTLNFSYSGGRLSRVEDQSGRGVTFGYSGGALTTFTDARGEATTYTYGPARGGVEGLITNTMRPDGSTVFSQVFNDDAQVSQQTDGEGGAYQFQYDGDTTRFTDPEGDTLTFDYTDGENLSAITDATGNAGAYRYDSRNRLTRYTSRLGNSFSRAYHADSGLVASVTDLRGETTRYSYEEQTQDGFEYHVESRVDYADGTNRRFSYDASGNATQLTDEGGDTWSFTYNDRGQLLTARNPLGGTSRFTYNDDGTLESTTSADGVTRTFIYDDLKRVSRVRAADGSEVAFERSASDLVTAFTNQLGDTVRFGFDSNNQLASVADALGGVTRLAYDSNLRVTGITSRAGDSSAVEFDGAGRPVELTDQSGRSRTIEHDSRGLVTAIRDAVGALVSYAYDDDGRIIEATDSLGRTVTYERDPTGRALSRRDRAGGEATFTYDERGRLRTATDAAGRARTFTFDQRGSLASLDIGGLTVRTDVNALGDLNSLTDPNGSVWRRSYSDGGRRESITDPLGQTIEYGYDDLGRRNEVRAPTGTAMSTFDLASRVTRREYSDGVSYDYAYDAAGRLTSTMNLTVGYDAEDRVTDSNGIRTEYDGAGRITRITYADGKAVEYSYDNRGRLQSLRDWIGGETTFEYDASNALTGVNRPNGVSTSLGYDDNNRLASLSHAGENVSASMTLERDASGLITSSTNDLPLQPRLAPGTLNQAFDAASQIESATYDGRGRLLSDSLRSYTWTESSRLMGYEGQDGSARFTYDGAGSRVSRTTAAGTASYTVNYATPLPTVGIEGRPGGDQRYYIYLPNGAPFALVEADDTRRFYHYDYKGSTILLTDDSGAVTDSYASGPFGEGVRQQGDSDQPFVYQGAGGVMQEAGTSLYRMGVRYYDSAWGRFLSRDPIITADPRRGSPYQFAQNNPLFLTDPSGLVAVPQGFYNPQATTSGDVLGFVTRALMGLLFGALIFGIRRERYAEASRAALILFVCALAAEAPSVNAQNTVTDSACKQGLGNVYNGTICQADATDTILGLTGNDAIQGLEPSDVICSGNNNTPACNTGFNINQGVSGNDTLSGSSGSKELLGGDIQDDIDSGGKDTLIGPGNDTIFGDGGRTELAGGGGSNEFDDEDLDTLFGDDGGMDILSSGGSNDICVGSDEQFFGCE